MSTLGFGVGLGAVIGVAVAGSLCGSALAQDPATLSDAVVAMLGSWEFSNADHDKICRFIFRADAVASGYKLDIDKNCPSLFPATKDIVAWAADNYGALRLLDAGGNTAIELTEAEAGIYDGFEPGQGRYVLQSAAAAPVRSAEDIVGDWAISRGTGKPICMLTLANNPAGDRQFGAQGQAGLRCACCPFRADVVAHRPGRPRSVVGARADLALRRE